MDVLCKALVVVANTDGALRHRANQMPAMVRNMAKLYFGINELTEEHAREIKKTVSKVWTGLAGDITLVVAEEVTKGQAHGLVPGTLVEKVPSAGLATTGPQFVEKDTKKKVADTRSVVRQPGDVYKKMEHIHLKRSVFGTRASEFFAVVTLVHEATHKYAGTNDYYTHKEGGPASELLSGFDRTVTKEVKNLGWTTVTKVTHVPEAYGTDTRSMWQGGDAWSGEGGKRVPLETSKLLTNADSVAWFIYCAAKTVQELIDEGVAEGERMGGSAARELWNSATPAPRWWRSTGSGVDGY
jgi:hypothetical protein